jgi:hypothetical protein
MNFVAAGWHFEQFTVYPHQRDRNFDSGSVVEFTVKVPAEQDAGDDSCVNCQTGREGHAAFVAASLANQDGSVYVTSWRYESAQPACPLAEAESSGKKYETPARKLGSLVGELGSKTVASLSQSGGNRARQRTHFAPVGFGCASYKSNSPGAWRATAEIVWVI